MYISSNLLIKKDTIRCISIEFISIIRPYEFQCDDIKDRRRTLEKIELKNRSARIIEQSIKKNIYSIHSKFAKKGLIRIARTIKISLSLSLFQKKRRKEKKQREKGGRTRRRKVEERRRLGAGGVMAGAGGGAATLWRLPTPRRSADVGSMYQHI